MKRTLWIQWSFGAVIAMAFSLGCAYEWVHQPGALGSEVRSLSIETLRNDSMEPGFELMVTDALLREFLRRGSVSVVRDSAEADWVLHGRVLPVRTASRTFSSVVMSLEHEVTVKLELSITRRDGSELSLDSTLLTGTEFYLASADVEAGRKNREEALRRVAMVLAERVHDSLYEQTGP